VAGINSPAAPASSSRPVSVVMRSGRGNTAGTIRMRSCLRFPQ
jgi:hypothetical protein